MFQKIVVTIFLLTSHLVVAARHEACVIASYWKHDDDFSLEYNGTPSEKRSIPVKARPLEMCSKWRNV